MLSHSSILNQEDKPITVCHHILQLVQNQQNFGNLYLGGVGSLKQFIVQKYKLTAVLTIMDSYIYEIKNVKGRIEELKIKQSKWIDVEDEQDEDIQIHFQECFNFIEKILPQYNLLIHCQAGVSRSATIVIYYIMRKLKLPLELANKFVVSKRYIASPNQGFWTALQKYQQKVLNEQNQKNINIQPINTINDPKSQFDEEGYHKKFANHIICLNNNGSLDKGNLFLGQYSILKPNFIQSLKITSIISVVEQSYYKRMRVKEIIEHMNITQHIWINIEDDPQEKQIADHFDLCYKFIEQHLEEGNVLVHCQKGVSRSATIVIAYLIKKFKVTYKDALDFVKKKRSVVKPNEGFEMSLIQYSQKLIS